MFNARPAKRRAMSLAGLNSPKAIPGQCPSRRPLGNRHVTGTGPYVLNRPDLAALGARDGFVLSGLAMDNNDALSRRDQGLQFLDVTWETGLDRSNSGSFRKPYLIVHWGI